ncbi:MAG: HEAT repeat domain-containing protein [Pseudanabaenaceae cyanobacterium]
MTSELSQLEQAIDAIERASSPAKMIEAVQQLVNLQCPEAIPTLIKVLGYNNPSAAAIAMGGVIALGEVAVPHLLNLMDDHNYGARAYTVRALASIADPRALDRLLYCALQDFAPSVRRAAIKGLGNVASKLASLDINKVINTLQLILQDEDWSMRYAAIVALSRFPAGISLLRQWRAPEKDPVVKARLLLAIA